MSNLVLSTTNESSTGVLVDSLKSENASIRSIALNEIWNALSKDDSWTLKDNNMIVLIIAALDSKETNDSAVAVKILSKVLRTSYDDKNVKAEYNKRLEGNATVRCRVYEIAVNLAKHSETMLRNVREIIDKALTEVKEGDDILVNMNIFELLASLCEVEHGILYLESKKIFEHTSKLVQELNQNNLNQLMIPGIMIFFGKVAFSQPIIIQQYPNMIQCLFDLILCNNQENLVTALDTLANLAATSDGKLLLSEHYTEGQLRDVFARVGHYIRNGQPYIKSRCISTLEVVFSKDAKSDNVIRYVFDLSIKII